MQSKVAIALSELAADQWGLMTSRQAAVAGVPRNTWQRLAARGDILERVAHGVYRFRMSAPSDHLDLRAAWLQLAPEVPAWERRPAQGVVSHRSAASLYGLGHLPALAHEFTVDRRKQSRRRDVRIHQRRLAPEEITETDGLPVTRPARIVSDLLTDKEDPESVGQVAADAIRAGLERPRAFASQLGRHAAHFGLRRGDGVQLLRWLLDLAGDPRTTQWMAEARAVGREADEDRSVDAMKTTIDAAGRIVVPKRLRDELGLSGGQELEISARDGRIEVDVAPVGIRLKERDGVVTAVPDEPLPRLTTRQVREVLERTRR